MFGGQSWAVEMDRTQWVLTHWYPFVLGDKGKPSYWPNPFFPVPYAGDGVCEVSRGENAPNSGGDCAPMCGNGIAHPRRDILELPRRCKALPGRCVGGLPLLRSAAGDGASSHKTPRPRWAGGWN